MSNVSTPWFAVSMGLIGLIVGYGLHSSMGGAGPIIPSGPTPTPTVADEPAVTAPPADADDDPVLGNESATVTIIEFTDYQCPFCARHFTDTYPQIKQNYIDTGKVKYITRDYPLSFHPLAQKAAEASECADEQGKFSEMHDLLFKNQAIWSALPDGVPTFKQYAADLKLNTTAFNTCLDTGAMAAEVNADLAAGGVAGISGTPGFWILGPNGESKNISGAYPYATFQAAIDAML